MVNVALYASVFERYRKEVMAARLMVVQAKVAELAGVAHPSGRRVSDRSAELGLLSISAGGPKRARHPRDARMIP